MFIALEFSLTIFLSTFHPIGDKEKILAKLEEVCAELEEDMERTGWTGKTVTLKYKLDTYQGRVVPVFYVLFSCTDTCVSQSSHVRSLLTGGYRARKKIYLRLVVISDTTTGYSDYCLQTGKELLLPELPLRVRLIGMRVTKLKDLREDIDSKPGSIKRVRWPELKPIMRLIDFIHAVLREDCGSFLSKQETTSE